MRKRAALMVLILLLGLAACAPKAQDVRISNVWARPGLAGDNSAVYFQIQNDGAAAEQITGAGGDVAASVELHKSTMENGVMKMEPQTSVEVPAGQSLEFKPGSYHIMLVNLKKDLKAGDTFAITLTLQQRGPQTLQVTVKEQ